ncbi:SIR2 family protein [Nitrosospira multiformis]|uniref:SIR2 family protein n=1 Tax=Nitrosospira multiformis TaxID=1231 RepID=UPI000895B2FC|nr:SIR2 family protein [Nitrosospira multiformis]SEA64501.1 SIR2-like domain-containing protein [Nitrosospira multiformis]
MAALEGVKEQADWAKWYRDKTGEDPSYSDLLEKLGSTPAERQGILHRYIEPTDEDREQGKKIPTVAHHAIAGLVQKGYIRVIVTTNFDRLMENALHEKGIEPTIVYSVDALKGAPPIIHSKCFILKLHGDYKDVRTLNTEIELSSYPKEYNELLDRIFDEHGLIVCGWSGLGDVALRKAFLRAPNRRYSIFWAARENLKGDAQELAKHRGACVIPISDADSFFSTLQQNVETLEQSHCQNPCSIELLVNNTKRFLAKPEHRIKLDDLFIQETNRLIELLI